MRISATNVMALCAVGLVAGVMTSARAGITDPALMITATNSQGTATLAITLAQGAWSGGDWTYAAGGEVELRDASSGARIALLRDLSIEMIADPQVTVNFTAVSGISDTTFSFGSGVLSYPAIDSSLAFATAGVTVTDNDSNGAMFTGLFAGDAFQASYNSGTVFDTLLASFSVPIDDSQSASERSPVSGTTLIGTTFNMQADWHFTLSANDQVGGTSLFRIIPAPGAAGLLGLTVVLAGRRRR